MRRSVPLEQAYRLLNHGPTVLITTAHGQRDNLMAAAWVMPLDFSPPKVALVMDRSTYSRELLEASGELVLNIPPRALATQTLKAGSCSGKEGDKFAALGLQRLNADRVAVPLVAGCIAWLECRLLPEPRMAERYDLFLAEVVAASADDQVFTAGRWQFTDDQLRTLHHVAGGHFLSIGQPVETDTD